MTTTNTTATAAGAFDYKGQHFTWSWFENAAGEKRLSVVDADPVVDADGFDVTEWPGDAEVSRQVGTPVTFCEAGENAAEAIFSTDPRHFVV
jgi:hypothetical protein